MDSLSGELDGGYQPGAQADSWRGILSDRVNIRPNFRPVQHLSRLIVNKPFQPQNMDGRHPVAAGRMWPEPLHDALPADAEVVGGCLQAYGIQDIFKRNRLHRKILTDFNRYCNYKLQCNRLLLLR